MKTFNELVSEIFKIPTEDITDGLSPKDIPEWDSMNYLLFIAELEKEYAFSFSMDEVITASCLGDLRTILVRAGKIK